MRSLELCLEQYNTDKINNHYLERYDQFLTHWLEKRINLLELGIYKGGSLLLWRDYFPLGTIVGVDLNLPQDFEITERIHLYEGSQADTAFLSRMANEIAPDGFDIIIDDASHVGELTKTTFWHLFDNHLKPNGLYVIEDWGTSYWDDWPDGKSLDLQEYIKPSSGLGRLRMKIAGKLNFKTTIRSHNYGMVGFIKQLVDEQGAHDVTMQHLEGKLRRGSKFESITITPSIVFIRKAGSS
ncbi:MAG: class I SAM-dependent methyltransferase [Rubrobacteridae bacterium]|nr:class I SAM-dependent methyltransferase [Rubrobacteridae bacterium]